MSPELSNDRNNRLQETARTDEPWWLKHAIRFVGAVSSLGILIFGVFACITILPICMLAGILQMLCGVLVALIEAPCLCMFLDFAQVPSQFFENKPFWYRAVLYIGLSFLPISLCIALSTMFGSGLLFIVGCVYGALALRKKTSSAEVRAKASSSELGRY